MLRRKIEADLKKWKQDGAKQALCFVGAPEIGKATAVRAFGQNNYRTVIELNFQDFPKLRQIFSSPDPEWIFARMTALTHQEIDDQKTLLILAEVQQCPEACTAIKSLLESGRVDILATQSLPDSQSGKISFSDDSVLVLPMFPMIFEEFLWALQVPETTLRALKDCYEQKKPVDEAIHTRMLKLFGLYMAVGGMPEAVQTYVDSHDLARVEAVHAAILQRYRQDIHTFAGRKAKGRIREVFDAIPDQLCAKNRRFKVARISRKARVGPFASSFSWLETAGLALPCTNVSAPVSLLSEHEKRNLFKLYLCDTGLLCCLLGGSTAFQLLLGDLGVHMGAILENVFAKELKSRNLNLFYFDSSRRYNLDFLIEKDGQIAVVQIQSGKFWKKHASLDAALQHPDWKLDSAIVFCPGNLEETEQVLYLPLYMILFL